MLLSALTSPILEAKEKEWIGVDLDGTLAKYTVFKGADHIGEPVPKMVERVKRWLSNGKKVKIFTARVNPKQEGYAKSVTAIKKWCKEHIGKELEITYKKDQYMIELWDDRAVRVKKNTGQEA